MYVLIIVICFVLLLKQHLSFKIEIIRCSTPNGIDGYCRLQEHCVGYKDTLAPHGCSYGTVCCPRRKVSKKKCYEYGEAVFGRNDAMTLLPRSLSNAVSRIDDCAIKAVPLIVGGERANLKEFPHMAALGYGDDPNNAKWSCGGSLISEQFVLTAAHCVYEHRAPKFVKLGATNVITDKNKNVKTFGIQEFILHPNHKGKENDIALVKLSRKVKFTSFVRPACLDYKGAFAEKSAIATGWGYTSNSANGGSQELMKVQLDIVNKEDCVRAFRIVQDSVLCAGVLSGGKDTCRGDSGGPLQTIRAEPYCMYKVIGVTSYGIQCGYQWSPAIYSRTFSYIPWIESIVWPNES